MDRGLFCYGHEGGLKQQQNATRRWCQRDCWHWCYEDGCESVTCMELECSNSKCFSTLVFRRVDFATASTSSTFLPRLFPVSDVSIYSTPAVCSEDCFCCVTRNYCNYISVVNYVRSLLLLRQLFPVSGASRVTSTVDLFDWFEVIMQFGWRHHLRHPRQNVNIDYYRFWCCFLLYSQDRRLFNQLFSALRRSTSMSSSLPWHQRQLYFPVTCDGEKK